jgi:hypothetical protein
VTQSRPVPSTVTSAAAGGGGWSSAARSGGQEGGGDDDLWQVVTEEFEGAAVDISDARDGPLRVRARKAAASAAMPEENASVLSLFPHALLPEVTPSSGVMGVRR